MTRKAQSGKSRLKPPAPRDNPKARVLAKRRKSETLEKAASDAATYTGSPEHKSYKSFAGVPKLKSDKYVCPVKFKHRQDMLTDWIQTAIRNGHYSDDWGFGKFPKYVWHRDTEDGCVYEGRALSPDSSLYKGYPLEPGQEPEGV